MFSGCKHSKMMVEMLRNAEYQEHLNEILKLIYIHYNNLVQYMRTNNLDGIDRTREYINMYRKEYNEAVLRNEKEEKGKFKIRPSPFKLVGHS